MQAVKLDWHTAEGLWWWTAAVLIALFASTAIAYLLDARTIDGVSVWVKPMKFQGSLALHFATLALITGTLNKTRQQSALLLIVAAASILATLFEISYIMIQAGQQERSHFNVGTPFHAAMYALMAIGAVVILSAATTVGVVAALDSPACVGLALRHSIVLGLVGGTVLTLIVAFTMGGRMTHHVGIEVPGSPSLPLTGWSLSVGDLRVPHFFATHMMQAIPLAGLAAQTLFAPAAAAIVVWCFAGGWALLTLATYRQALSELPLFSTGCFQCMT